MGKTLTEEYKIVATIYLVSSQQISFKGYCFTFSHIWQWALKTFQMPKKYHITQYFNLLFYICQP